MLNYINYSGSYGVQKEGSFFHVQSQNYNMPDMNDMERIYINCETQNIAELARTILASNTNNNFYMKFVANEENGYNPRNEKMVIYCNKNEKNYSLQLVNYCKQIRPELFKNVDNRLPFFKLENDIASVASQPKSDQYINLRNQTIRIPQSVNYFISNILRESYMESVRELAVMDNNLDFLLNKENYFNETLYIQNYSYIFHNKMNHNYLLESMKSKMSILANKNNIEIDGLNKTNYIIQYNEKNIEQYKYR